MTPPLVIFDLDGTLAVSKQPITKEMAEALSKLLAHTKVAVISGGNFTQLKTQVADQLPETANLYLLPTSGAALYECDSETPKKIYEERISETDAKHIETAIRDGAKETGLIDFTQKVYGERIEYRGGQVTLSALGQHAPIDAKLAWDPTHTKREALRASIAKRLPDFLVAIGGTTSIDITQKGIDKAYGVNQICRRLKVEESDAVYVGDELRKHGNDEAVYKTNITTKAVQNPDETRAYIESLLNAS